MTIEVFFTILLTAVFTAGASSLFTYWLDKINRSYQYAEESLRKLYIPIYKKLGENIYPGDGYEGINENQVSEIKEIIEEHPELTDPELERIVENIFIDVMHNNSRSYNIQRDLSMFIYDENRELLEYVLFSFNSTRHKLGLPSNNIYSSKRSLKIHLFKTRFKKKYIDSKLRKKLK
ncbi:hypothetical protein [Metabacillus idriensis]|uniref:hypothetical protein n=1 Tax=Metabacillus idriensis TaxID=324768 RepID=UPI00174B872A|nr:hypothetical protein [Metabacillus idriensis]